MKNVKLNVAGTDYDESYLFSLHTHRQLFDGEPTVGNCVSGELTATVRIPNANIPKNAKLTPYIKKDNTWVKKSEFFVYSRKIDKETGWIELTAYDAIFKAEEQFATGGGQSGWPKKDVVVMQSIAQRTGTTICTETLTLLNSPTGRYNIPFPGIVLDNTNKPDGATTMREVAGRIAAMYAGNWIIDNNGKWRLVVLGDIPAETNLLIDENADYIKFGNDRISLEPRPIDTPLLMANGREALLIGGVHICLTSTT